MPKIFIIILLTMLSVNQSLADFVENMIEEKVQNIDGKNIIWMKDKHSKISFIRLGKGFSAKQRETINPFLRKEHIRHIKSIDMRNSFDAKIVFLSKNIIELRVDDMAYGYYLYYDLNRAKRYSENDIFVFKEDENGASIIIDLIFEKNGWKEEDKKVTSCQDYSKNAEREELKGYFTDIGFVFRGMEDGLLNKCDSKFLIPYEKLERYRNRDFPYNFEELIAN